MKRPPATPPGHVGARSQTWRYTVSFEFDLRPVLTHKGQITASSYGNAVARATKAAQRALRPVNVRSLVCVLLERIEDAPQPEPPPSGFAPSGEAPQPEAQPPAAAPAP